MKWSIFFKLCRFWVVLSLWTSFEWINVVSLTSMTQTEGDGGWEGARGVVCKAICVLNFVSKLNAICVIFSRLTVYYQPCIVCSQYKTILFLFMHQNMMSFQFFSWSYNHRHVNPTIVSLLQLIYVCRMLTDILVFFVRIYMVCFHLLQKMPTIQVSSHIGETSLRNLGCSFFPFSIYSPY